MNLLLNLLFIIILASPLLRAEQCLELFKDPPTVTSTFPPLKKGFIPKNSTQGLLELGEQRMYYRLDVPEGVTHQADSEVHLLIHGLIANSKYLDGLAAELLAAGKTVLRVDLLGHGQSLRHSDKAQGTVADQAQAVSRVLYFLGIRNLSIYGHSLGGAVAMQTAVVAPSLFKGRLKINQLVIDEPYVYPVDKWMVERSGNQMANMQGFMNPFAVVDFFIGAAMSTEAARKGIPQSLAQAIRRFPKYFAVDGLDPDVQAAGAFAVFPTEDMRTIAAQISVPTTLIRGQFSAAVAPRELMDAIPGFFAIPITVKEAKSGDPHHHVFHNPARISRIIQGRD